MSTMDVDQIVEEIFSLYQTYGKDDYLGEAVSKTNHSIQCARLAELEQYDAQVVLGAFFHDIGHLVGEAQGLPAMVTDGTNLGAKDHDKVGGQYLRSRGFPDVVCDIVQGHVQAKRYLVWKDRQYYESLTPASKMTLEHQGGLMTDEEGKEFEASRLFDIIIKMRTWDERGKEADIQDISLDRYKQLCKDVLNGTRS